MNLNDLSTVWVLIKPSIEDGDPREAADLLVNHLIDDGMTATEIKKAFGKDEEIIEEIKVTEDIEIIYPLLNTALNELAKDCSITEDYRTIFDDISHPIYIDEIHMGKEGNKIIAEKIYEKILPIITKDILKILFE